MTAVVEMLWSHEAGEYIPILHRVLMAGILLLLAVLGVLGMVLCMRYRRRIKAAQSAVRGFPLDVEGP
jgi:hypothetical protein